MSREAMQMALEALELYQSKSSVQMFDDAVKALRQALETEREWVGLTADEIWKCNKPKSGSAVEFHIWDFAEAIEAKLKEKNT